MGLRDLTGLRFGRLTVLALDHTANHRSYWLCKCDCGTVKVIRGDCLHSNTGRPTTVSCGCYHREKNPSFIDNRSKTKLYHVYYGILQRCYNPKCTAFKYYGGRGIKCTFKNWVQFRDWAVSHGYKEGLTIDRIDVNGDYAPDNCRWITNSEQQLNKRPRVCDHMITYNGQQLNLSQLAKLTGAKYHTLYYRFMRGIPLLA